MQNHNGQMKYFSCKINKKPIDFFESDNTIVIVGNNFIELYKFNQNDIELVLAVNDTEYINVDGSYSRAPFINTTKFIINMRTHNLFFILILWPF